jgi:hypothetical protein
LPSNTADRSLTEPPGRIDSLTGVNAAFTSPSTEADATIAQESAGVGRAAPSGIAPTSGPTIHPIDLPPPAVDTRRSRLKPRDTHVSLNVSTDTPT